MTIRAQVAEFHLAIGQSITPHGRPHVPSTAMVRQRVRFTTEEYCELLTAAGVPWPIAMVLYHGLSLVIRIFVARHRVILDDFIDAFADMDYFAEGTRQICCVNGEPIAAEVHRANLQKVSGPKRADGKQLKPAGWRAPNIANELLKQGWRP